MSETGIQQAVIVTDRASIDPNTTLGRIALFDEDGGQFTGSDEGYSPVVTTSAVGTTAKSTTSPEPDAESFVLIKFNNGNTATSPTMAFNGGTARAMQLGGTASLAAKLVVANNGIVLFFFDGTILHQIGAYT